MKYKKNQVIVRDWIEADYERYRHWNIGDFEWMKFNGPYYAKPTIEEIDQEIKNLESAPLSSRKRIIADATTNQLIGTVSWYWQSKETNWMSIGLAVYDETHWGNGIGSEALSKWIDLLFEERKELVRLDLRTWSGNIGMMKLAEKLGFTLEAQFRKARIVNGEYYDSIGYGILREEWEK